MSNSWTWWEWLVWIAFCSFQGQMLRSCIPNLLYRHGMKKYGHCAIYAAIEMFGPSYSIRACWKALKALDECRHVHFYGDECDLCCFVSPAQEVNP